MALLTHPHLSKAALPKLEIKAEGFSGDFPGILGQSLSLRLQDGTNVGQAVTQAIGVF